jgi:hypothetical protein
MNYCAADLAYFFGLMYDGLQCSTLNDLFMPGYGAHRHVQLFNLADFKRACPLINMAHGFGLTKFVNAFLDGLFLLTSARPTCCQNAMKGWRESSSHKSYPWHCNNDGWRSEGYEKAAKITSASFNALDAPLLKLLFAKYIDKH